LLEVVTSLFTYRRSTVTGAAKPAIRSLLVLCTGNLCRSPMAAALFAQRARDARHRLRVASAGIAAFVGHPPPGPVIALLEGRGVDVSRHKAQQLTGGLAHRHDLILVMDRAQQAFVEHHWPDLKGKVYRLGAWRDQDVDDPYGLTEECYEECLKRIEACVADWGAMLRGEQPPPD